MFEEKDKDNLLGILEATGKIKEYISNIKNADIFFKSSVIFDAVLMNFVVIGEMVDRISLEFKEENPQIDWFKIKAFRNIVAHDYFGVDAEEVWQICKKDIVELEKRINEII
mgnify:CR=1 FL=1